MTGRAARNVIVPCTGGISAPLARAKPSGRTGWTGGGGGGQADGAAVEGGGSGGGNGGGSDGWIDGCRGGWNGGGTCVGFGGGAGVQPHWLTDVTGGGGGGQLTAEVGAGGGGGGGGAGGGGGGSCARGGLSIAAEGEMLAARSRAGGVDGSLGTTDSSVACVGMLDVGPRLRRSSVGSIPSLAARFRRSEAAKARSQPASPGGRLLMLAMRQRGLVFPISVTHANPC